MKAVGDFPGRRCLLLRREQAEGDGPRPCGQRGFELGKAQLGQLYLLVGDSLAQWYTARPFKCLAYRDRPRDTFSGESSARHLLVTNRGREIGIGRSEEHTSELQ